jgi:integrase
MGSPDPRITSQGKIDFRLKRQLAFYGKQDPPPDRVKPIPVDVIRHIMATALIANSVDNLAIADMIALALFFLLRPGEYTGTKSETSPFRLCDVQLFIGRYRIDHLTADFATVRSATFATLTFTDQKNGVRGEVIGLARSGNIQLCPVLSIIRRVVHLREHNAPHTTPLASYFHLQRWRPVKPADISAVLRLAVAILGTGLGFAPKDVSARSLRASGAMALLCARVDTDVIKLLGRWRSDEMLRYLHLQAEPVMRDFAAKMLHHGSFVLTPGPDVAVPSL